MEENKSLRSRPQALKEQVIEQQSTLLTSICLTNKQFLEKKTMPGSSRRSPSLREKINLFGIREKPSWMKYARSQNNLGTSQARDGSSWSKRRGDYLDRKERDQQPPFTKSRADLIGLRSDNDALRKYIAQKGAEQQMHLRMSSITFNNSKNLKAIMEMWIVKHSKSSAEKELSQSQEIELLKLLPSFGKSGKASAEFLKNKSTIVSKLVCKYPIRILLVRHIVAVLLIDQVFEPFASGLPSSLSQAIGKLVMSHGFS